MLRRRLALVEAGTTLVVLGSPVAAQTAPVTIEQINSIVFPAQGKSAAKDICTGLKEGVLSRDQIGEALAEVQQALERFADRICESYVSDFNRAASSVPGCNAGDWIENSNLNRWSYERLAHCIWNLPR